MRISSGTAIGILLGTQFILLNHFQEMLHTLTFRHLKENFPCTIYFSRLALIFSQKNLLEINNIYLLIPLNNVPTEAIVNVAPTDPLLLNVETNQDRIDVSNAETEQKNQIIVITFVSIQNSGSFQLTQYF